MSGQPAPLRTALHPLHVSGGATMGEEAGWEVPLSYRDPLQEAGEVRRRAGLFDLSHVGRIRIRGEGALRLLKRACTADAGRQEQDTSVPTLLCGENGGIIDACRLIRLEGFCVLTTSPARREKVLAHLGSLAGRFGAKVDDQTPRTAMLAAAGPAVAGILDTVLPFRVSDLPDGAVKLGSLLVAKYIAERADMAGEWGVRVSVPNMIAGQAWRFITERAGERAVAPCGCLARDVLRIEAGLPAYGREIDETIDPVTAGLEEYVGPAHDFIGAEAVEKIKKAGAARRLVGLILQAPADGRQGPVPTLADAVLDAAGRQVGAVTSATFSPALQKVIAMAYVSPAAAEPGTKALVRIDAHSRPAQVTSLPFVEPAN